MKSKLMSEDTKRIIISATDKKEHIEYPKKFWCYNPLSIDEHCCWWHYIFYPNGGPERDGIFHPLYKYEQEIIECLEEGRMNEAKRLIAVYKATGLGLTELILLWILFRAATDPWFQDKEAVIFTGPNVDLAKKLIQRIKVLAEDRVNIEDKGVFGLIVEGSRIWAYPSNNIDAARGLPRVSVVFGDEGAFFQMRDDNEILTVGERYVGKSNSYVIWVSTAGDEATGFMWTILEDKKTKYIKFQMYVNRGLEKDPITGTSIFNVKFINEARKLASFDQEYNGIWGYNIGDIYSSIAVDECCSDDFQIQFHNLYANRIGFCDPGYGTSKFGICITEMREKIPFVIFSKSYDRESATQMVREMERLDIIFSCGSWGCDKANPEVIKDMREELHFNVTAVSNKEVGRVMTVEAVKKVQKGKVRIHPDFINLKKQLQTIKYGKNGLPHKTDGNPFDEGDAFQGNLYLRSHGGGYVGIVNELEDF